MTACLVAFSYFEKFLFPETEIDNAKITTQILTLRDSLPTIEEISDTERAKAVLRDFVNANLTHFVRETVKLDDKTGWYEYDNKEYAIITVDIDTEYPMFGTNDIRFLIGSMK